MTLLNRRHVLFGSAALGLMPSIAFSNTDPNKISVSVYNDYLPLSAMKDGQWIGYIMDFSTRLIQQSPQTLELAPLADLIWERALRIIETGDLQLLFEVSYREERTKFMDYIGSTDVERVFLVVSEDVPLEKITSFDDFQKIGKQILLNTSVAYSEEFDKRVKEDLEFQKLFQIMDGTVATNEDYELQVARMISAGRIGGYFFSEVNHQFAVDLGDAEIDKGGKGARLKSLRIELFGEPTTFVAVSKVMDPKLKEIIRNNYKQSRSDGSFDAIWKKWNPNRVPPPDVNS